MNTAYLATTLARTVASWMPDILFRVPETERVLYLTFDDGPTPKGTPFLLDLLDRYEAKATCFLIGRHAERYPDLVRALDQAGHTIGNHTFTHPDAWRTRSDLVRDDLERCTTLLESMQGRSICWMRPPYGRFTRAMRRWCGEQGQRMVLWDTLPADYLPSARMETILHRSTRWIRPGSVIVLHDNPKFHPVTLPAVERMLERLSDDGWTFKALPASSC